MQLTNSFPDEPSTVEDTTKFVLTCGKKCIDSDHTGQCSKRNSPLRELPLCSSKDDISDTGSLFDYAEEFKSEEISGSMANCDIVLSKFHECNIEVISEENINTNNLSRENVSTKIGDRSVTPELSAKIVLDESEKPVTPENRTDFLQKVVGNSIKKSHKKNKVANKTKFLSSEVLHDKLEATEEGHGKDEESFQHNENGPDTKVTSEQDHPGASKSE